MTVSKDNIRIKITIPKSVNKVLKEKSESENRSVSNYIYSLICKDLESK